MRDSACFINRLLPVLSQSRIIFIITKLGKFPTCWQQVSRRVIQHARLKFQPRMYRISAAPVAKRFEFASEQYFPRFGLISGIIISPSRVRASRSFVVSIFKYYRRILGTSSLFPHRSRGSRFPVLAICENLVSFSPPIEINRGLWIDFAVIADFLFLPRDSFPPSLSLLLSRIGRNKFHARIKQSRDFRTVRPFMILIIHDNVR